MAATGLDQNMSQKRQYKTEYLVGDVPLITGAVVVDRSLADPEYLKAMYGSMDVADIIMYGK